MMNFQEPDRVRRHTSPQSLHQIEKQIEASIRFYATQPEPVLTRRIEELEREWDLERWLETNASTLALTGAVLGLTGNRKWFLLPIGVLGFLFQHAIQGWCPPVPIFRRLGVRTRGEIDREKFALKALRGDFKNLPPRQPTEDFPAAAVLETINR
jgi:hypothetical protein